MIGIRFLNFTLCSFVKSFTSPYGFAYAEWSAKGAVCCSNRIHLLNPVERNSTIPVIINENIPSTWAGFSGKAFFVESPFQLRAKNVRSATEQNSASIAGINFIFLSSNNN